MATPIGVIVIGKMTKEDLFIGQGTVRVPSPAGDTQEGTLINIDSFGFVVYQDWAPTSIGPSSHGAVIVNVPGAEVHHKATVSFDGAGYLGQDNLVLNAKVLSPGVVSVALFNHDTVNTYSPGVGTLRVCVLPIPNKI